MGGFVSKKKPTAQKPTAPEPTAPEPTIPSSDGKLAGTSALVELERLLAQREQQLAQREAKLDEREAELESCALPRRIKDAEHADIVADSGSPLRRDRKPQSVFLHLAGSLANVPERYRAGDSVPIAKEPLRTNTQRVLRGELVPH